MKKYVQVVLVILSIFSLISLLFYRHEYNKLRYVLQVLNFFGTPGGAANVTCRGSRDFDFQKIGHPAPAWHRASNTIYVYSAFWDSSNLQHGVKAIAIGVLNENLNHGCYLWYENSNVPVKGEFSFSAIPRNKQQMFKNNLNSKYFSKPSKNKGYWFYCKPPDDTTSPTGVTFYKTNDDTAQAYIPIKLIDQTRVQFFNHTALCVMPRDTPFVENHKYLEFFAHHSVIGMKQFIVYGGELAYNIIGALDLDPKHSTSLVNLQWNFPFVADYELMRSVAEADCLVRSKQSFGSAISLAWNQFLVPKFHSNVRNLIVDYDPDEKISQFKLSVVVFCLEYRDEPISSATLPWLFRKSRYALPKLNFTVVLHKFNTRGSSVQEIKRDMAAVHWYTKCDLFDLRVIDKTEPKYDHSILRFKTDILQSDILQLKEDKFGS